MNLSYTLFIIGFLSYFNLFDNFQIIQSKNKIPEPILSSPISGITINDTCTFKWTSSGKKIIYEMIFATKTDFSDGKRIAVTDTFYTKKFTPEESGIWYWKVRAFKSKKIYSEWSFSGYFYVGLVPVQYISPGCNGNCSQCKHPCGRRRQNYDQPK